MTASPRWKRRPEGSTWGDWGPDDQLGRLNLLTPEKVKQGGGRGEGRAQLLPQPAARLSGRQRAQPAPLSAGAAADAARRPAQLHLRGAQRQSGRDRRHQRRRRDHASAVLDAVGQPRARGPAVRRRRRRQGRTGLLQRLSARDRYRRPHRCGGRGRHQYRAGQVHLARRRPRHREHGGQVRAGTRCHDRPARARRPQARGGRLRPAHAHTGSGQGRGRERRHGLPAYRLFSR